MWQSYDISVCASRDVSCEVTSYPTRGKFAWGKLAAEVVAAQKVSIIDRIREKSGKFFLRPDPQY
jgi:hypothetical protein